MGQQKSVTMIKCIGLLLLMLLGLTACSKTDKSAKDLAPFTHYGSKNNTTSTKSSSTKTAATGPKTHIVQKSETVYALGRLYKMTPQQIIKLNDLKEPYELVVGQKVKVIDATKPTQTASREPIETEELSTPSGPANQAASSNLPKPEPISDLPKRSASTFLWPVKGKVISRYGVKEGGLINDGINIQVPHGTPVKASENGVVAYVGSDIKGFGNLVLIKHEGGYMTTYAHMDEILFNRGDVVKRGQVIGKAGQSGSVKAPQLHFEVRRGKKTIDPLPFLSS